LAGDRTKIIALHSKHFARRQNGQSADDKKKEVTSRSTLERVLFFLVLILNLSSYYLTGAFRI